VVKITSAGKVTTVLKSERPWNPTGVALRHAWTSGLVFLRTKRAAEQRANSQHGKEINGNFRQTEPFRFSATEERGLTATVRGHLFEGTGLFPPRLEMRVKHRFHRFVTSVALGGRQNRHEPIGMREW